MCPICSRSFATRNNFNNHVRSHEKQKTTENDITSLLSEKTEVSEASTEDILGEFQHKTEDNNSVNPAYSAIACDSTDSAIPSTEHLHNMLATFMVNFTQNHQAVEPDLEHFREILPLYKTLNAKNKRILIAEITSCCMELADDQEAHEKSQQ